MIVVGLIIIAIAAAFVLHQYAKYRDRRDSVALYTDLHSFTLPYESKARERRY